MAAKLRFGSKLGWEKGKMYSSFEIVSKAKNLKIVYEINNFYGCSTVLYNIIGYFLLLLFLNLLLAAASVFSTFTHFHRIKWRSEHKWHCLKSVQVK